MGDVVAQILDLVDSILRNEELKVTVRNSVRNGVAAGFGGMIGGLLGGPWGAVPGAAIGAAIGAGTGEDHKPLWRVIADWTPQEKQRLAHRVQNIMQQVNVTDVAAFAAMAAGAAPAVRNQVIAAVVDFAQTEMGAHIVGR